MTVRYQNLKEKKVENSKFVRLPERMEAYNLLFGGPAKEDSERGRGFLAGGSYVISGESNAGKTTFLFQLSDAFSEAGHTVMFCADEMIESEMKTLQERLDLKHSFLFRASDSDFLDSDQSEESQLMRIIRGEEGLSPEMILMKDYSDMCKARKNEREENNKFIEQRNKERAKLGQELLPYDQGNVVLIVDSIQSISEGRRDALDMVKRFVKVNQMMGGVAFFISQVTKGGKFEGSNKLKHLVTAMTHLSVLKAEDDKLKEKQPRKIEVEKNRGARVGSIYTFLEQSGHRLMEDYEIALSVK